MKTILVGTLVLILLVGAVLLVKDYYVKRKFKKQVTQKYKMVEPLMQKFASKEAITDVEILILAKDPALRCGVFGLLEDQGRIELFPAEYFTQEKGAEGFLVNWLEFPTELGNAPDDIELLKKISLEGNDALSYYVFKYRTRTPHWIAQFNWMLGVTGPYSIESQPYDVPLRVFSRFNTVDSISPEKEARWVHENICKQGFRKNNIS